MSCVPVAGAVCAATGSMANTAPSKPINKQTANVFIQSSLSLDQGHSRRQLDFNTWFGFWDSPKSCVDVSPALFKNSHKPGTAAALTLHARSRHMQCSKSFLLDHLVGAQQDPSRQFNA